MQPRRLCGAPTLEAQTILHGFAVDLLADRRYCKSSKFIVSPANLQHFATNGSVYNILTCHDVVDKSVTSVANLHKIHLMWFTTDKSTASLQHAGSML